MPIQLEPLDAKSVTHPITIVAGKPRVFKIVKHGHDAGSVTVELVDGKCQVTNRSQRPVLVNGDECERGTLVDGDSVLIGKESFRVRVISTQSLAPEPERVSGYHPTPVPDTDVSLEVEEPLVAASKSTSESDRHRRRRSISASMRSPVETPKQTILNRVSSVFSVKSRSDRTREEALQVERRQLLEEAGRQVLAAHALGLPEQAFSDLLAGRTVTIRPEEVARAALERWRELSQRVALLDAEIAAVRQALGMGPDLGAVRLTAPHARVDLKQREDRVFATLDTMATQDLASAASEIPTAPIEAPPPRSPSVSGRSRVSGRRRQV